MDEREPPRREPPRPGDDGVESERDRRTASIILLVFVVAVVGGGIWLLDTLVDQRTLDDCAAQGRRNCAPISVPAR
jgi:hypothetical protein